MSPQPQLPDRFDPLGPTVHAAALPSGRVAHYIDEGRAEWPALLWFGGLTTTVRAFGLLEFARGLRESLGIRVISVQRNGLGETPFDPDGDMGSYVADVLAVLDELGVSDVALMAISGGGPYAARVATAIPERVRSVHLACAFSERLEHAPVPGEELAEDELMAAAEAVVADPAAWWRYGPESPTHRIPGFTDATAEEGLRAFHVTGQEHGARALAHERSLLGATPLPDLRTVTAPVHLYWGSADPLVTTAHLERWRDAFPNVARVRVYEGEGHDAQYRHWEQILLDVAGMADQVIVCDRGRSRLVAEDELAAILATGATLGSCAWA